jgi:hypothetical protein
MSREQAEQVAEQELQRVFDKADFRRLEVRHMVQLGAGNRACRDAALCGNGPASCRHCSDNSE